MKKLIQTQHGPAKVIRKITKKEYEKLKASTEAERFVEITGRCDFDKDDSMKKESCLKVSARGIDSGMFIKAVSLFAMNSLQSLCKEREIKEGEVISVFLKRFMAMAISRVSNEILGDVEKEKSDLTKIAKKLAKANKKVKKTK